MRLFLLVLCWCLSGAAKARVTGSSLDLRRPRSISLADTAMAAASPKETQGVEILSGSKKLLKKLLTEEFHIPVKDPRQRVSWDTNEAEKEELTESLNAPELAGEPADDAECAIDVDKMASVMIKKNIGSHKIKESEKNQYLNSGWHDVDKEQPGAVKIVCGDKESYIGLADHCLLWKNGKPVLKKEEEVTAMLSSGEYTNTNPGPGKQKVSCDYMRVFHIAPTPKVIPVKENGMKKKNGKSGGRFPWDIPGITWKIQYPKKQKHQEQEQKRDKEKEDIEADRGPPVKEKCVKQIVVAGPPLPPSSHKKGEGMITGT